MENCIKLYSSRSMSGSRRADHIEREIEIYSAYRFHTVAVLGEAVIEAAHILVVDDDRDIRHELQEYLELKGYRVGTADGGASMRRFLDREVVDLIILDLMMPGEDGLTLINSLRKTTDVSIIMLTAKGEPADQIVALELGADDYISKPCDLRQLLARVRSVLRRTRGDSGVHTRAEKPLLLFEGWRLDQSRRQLRSLDDVEVALTTGEFDLLEALATNAKRVLSRDQLLNLTKGRDGSPFDRSIDNLISRLRQKLEADPKHPSLIKTVQGVGYVFTAHVNRK